MHNKHKRDFWEAHFTACSKSRMSQDEYCRHHNLARSTFGYWKRKLANHPQPAQFYPLVIQNEYELPQATGVSLIFDKHRFRIELTAEFSAPTLKRLISAIEGL